MTLQGTSGKPPTRIVFTIDQRAPRSPTFARYVYCLIHIFKSLDARKNNKNVKRVAVPSKQSVKRSIKQEIDQEVDRYLASRTSRPTKPKPAAVAKPRGVGASIGSSIGSFLGNAAEDVLKTFIGFGDYDTVASHGAENRDGHVDPVPYPVVSNSLLGRSHHLSPQIPMMSTSMPSGMTRVTHREFIADINMTANPLANHIRIHPTLISTFPWLSQVAKQYQEYKWLGLVFEFRSTAANAVAANPGLGSVTLATQYDAGATDYPNKQAALSSLFATSCKPSDSMIHPIECDPDTLVKPWFYMHTDGSTNMSKARLQDMCFINIITQGAQADYSGAGELWVTYDILLQKPSVAVMPAMPSPTDSYLYCCDPAPQRPPLKFKNLKLVAEERKREERVDLGGRRIIKKKIEREYTHVNYTP